MSSLGAAEFLRLSSSFSETFSASASLAQRVQTMAEFAAQRQFAQQTNNNQTISDIKALEHPTLKVPYEILNKKFRSAQKNIDREVCHVQNVCQDVDKAVKGSAATSEHICQLISGVIDKLNVLKRKASESITEELDAANVCKRRLDHLEEFCLKSVSPNPVDTAAVTQWRKKRLDRMLVEHFLRCGYYDTAIQLALSSDIQDLTNIELFLVSRQVEESLLRRETAKCLTWCYDNKSKLRKIRSSLEFNLRQQEFVELIRQNRRLDAVAHARKHFSNLEPDQQQDLQVSMALFAFTADTQVEPYRSLFDEARWKDLIQQFRQENFKLYHLSNSSVFSVTLQSGLSALKTPMCYRQDGQKNPDCPVCSPHLNELAITLPNSHCSQSKLICAISGQPLNEHNQPMMLPNGYVYGEVALKQMAAANGGKVTCPRDKHMFRIEEALKVFVM